jgi:cyclopropane fatty-acyl-phospholipid synthase-like methyltransferase
MQNYPPVRLKSLFPRSIKYDQDWVRQHSMGENVLFNLESLTAEIPIKPGMRVLDLGCGKAISAIFMAKEYGVQVWAVDEAVPPADNYTRIKEADCDNKVFPLQADARNLPFAEDFFDVIIVVDSYTYFGTDEKYLPYICQFLKPDGYIAIVDVCFTQEIENLREVPSFLRKDFQKYWYYVHSVAWWQKLWEKTGLVKIKSAEILPAAPVIREEYIKDATRPGKKDPFSTALQKDTAGFISFFRLIAQRTSQEVYLQSYK